VAGQVILPLNAEALRAEAVGDAACGQDVQDGRRAFDRLWMHVAEPDAESVAAQVPPAQLVGMGYGVEDAQAAQRQTAQLLRRNARHGQALACDGLAVFEAGIPDVPRRYSQHRRQLPDNVQGSSGRASQQ